jgi:hypothetical protein
VAQTRDARPHGNGVVQEDVMLRRSPDMVAMLDYWDQTDDIVTGYKAVRDAGQKYLPKFPGEEDEEYKGRLRLTKMTNVYRDIVEGLAAKPFETEVTLADGAPAEIVAFTEDVDGSGNNISVFLYGVFFNGINSAIDWIYVDHPVADETIRTVADAKARGIRPYWSRVLGRNVLQPKSSMIDGKETLTYMRILEPGSPDVVRVFKRDEVSGVVRWATFNKLDNWIDPDAEWLLDTPPAGAKTQFAFQKEGTISIGVIPLVPFITGRRDGKSFKLFPAMRDAADLQIELYQQESGLKFAKTLTAYPMLACNVVVPAKGPDGQPLKMRVGPSRVIYGGRDGNGQAGSWEYLEPSATSLTFLANDIKDTKQDLRELGRQPLTATSGNLTVITTAVAAGKARSAVGAWAYGLKDAAENAMRYTCMFRGIAYEPEVNVNTEFDDGMDDAADITALISMRQPSGDNGPDISQETLWEEMRRRKKLSPEFTAERERERLLQEVPADTGEDTDPENVE